MLRGGSIAASSHGWWPNIASPTGKPPILRTSSPTVWCGARTVSTRHRPSQPDGATMFDRNYYATHPDMMECVSNEELRERYLVQELFRKGEVVLNYTHADRLVIGGVLVGAADVRLPDQTEPASAAGHPLLERRELAIVNVGQAAGSVTVDGETFDLASKDCLYVAMGAKDVVFSGQGARFYLVSCPAH